MYLLVTDRATCPRCGPAFGLILLAERVEDRRILEGHLGCPNCREHFPVRGGYGDLRPPGQRPPRDVEVELGIGLEEAPTPATDPSEEVEGALRLAALLGVESGPGFLLVMGEGARLAHRVAGMVEGIEVVAVGPGLEGLPEIPGVSRMAVGPGIPFFDGTFRGVALEGPWIRSHLEEGLRVLRQGARIVLLRPGEGDRNRLEEAGVELLLVTGKALVAQV